MIRKSFCAGVLTLVLLIPAPRRPTTLSPAMGHGRGQLGECPQSTLLSVVPITTQRFRSRFQCARASELAVRRAERTQSSPVRSAAGLEEAGRRTRELDNQRRFIGLAASSSSTDALAPARNQQGPEKLAFPS